MGDDDGLTSVEMRVPVVDEMEVTSYLQKRADSDRQRYNNFSASENWSPHPSKHSYHRQQHMRSRDAGQYQAFNAGPEHNSPPANSRVSTTSGHRRHSSGHYASPSQAVISSSSTPKSTPGKKGAEHYDLAGNTWTQRENTIID